MADQSSSLPDPSPATAEDVTPDGPTWAVEALLPALERFTRFDTPEQTGLRRAEWTAPLDEPLPQTGQGAEAVLAQLRDVVIPNGVCTGAPSYSGWINTMPTTVASAATLAATVAGPQRAWVQAFNTLEAVALRWLAELLRLPPTYQGIFTSGGSTANLVGLGGRAQPLALLGLTGHARPAIRSSRQPTGQG